MKKIRKTLLLITLLILLVGVVNASELSEDKTDTNSITTDVTVDTHTVSNMDAVGQDKKVDNNLSTTKILDKDIKNIKEASGITNWKQLSDAVSNAGAKTGNITITMGNGSYKTNGTIKFNNTKAVLTIDGNGQTIDGNKQQVFIVEKGASLVLKNITIKNAQSQCGAAIRNDGTLTITQSAITKSGTSTLVGMGGAIYNNGILNITQSTFSDNRASLAGAIFNNHTGKINIIQSTFTGNNASDEVSYGAGGAIENKGILTITQSVFTKGIAHTGGAIENEGTLTITNSTLANNRAKYQGGSIYNEATKCIVIGSNFTSNRGQEGAAVFSYGYINLTGNRFNDNTASKNKETIDLHGYWNGIFNNNIYKSTSISLKTNNLKLKENRTTYYNGEDVVLNFTISLDHNKYYDKDILERLDDITIYVNDKKTATTTYKNYTLSNLKPGNYSVYYNTCKGSSNTINFTVNPITNWEELSEAVDYAENLTKDVTLKLAKGYYTNTATINWTNPSATLIIDGNGQLLDGNRQLVFHIGSTASMILKKVTIDDARSEDGAIYNEGTLTITDSTLQNNIATYGGGAIINRGILNITNCTLANNTAATYGGAIKNGRVKLTVSDSTFINNHASTGGAIFSFGKTNLTGNKFINNTADNKETIDLYGYSDGHSENNTYESTDIALKNIKLSIKDNQKIFNLGEDVVLNYSFALKSPQHYDTDVMEQLENITIYVNDVEYATANKDENYTLILSRPGDYTVYYKICNQKSNTVKFTVKSLITNWQQLRDAVDDAKDKTDDVTLYLGEGNYTNTATITWNNKDIILTVEGEGQTIDGNQLQVFKITDGASFVLKNITITNAKSKDGGAIYNDGMLNITNSTLANNTAVQYGGAIRSGQNNLTVADTTFINNHAKIGGAIFSYGNTNLTDNKFINNTADNNETIDLYKYGKGCFDNNIYESTDIDLKALNLSIKGNQSIFNPAEDIVLNYSIVLEHPNYYDEDIPEILSDITLYINGIENVTTKYENYTLTNLKSGEYTVYYMTSNHKSNTVNFTVTPITNWQQLSEAVDYAESQKINITLSLLEGDYTNTGTITWNNKKIVLTIDGNGQTIDANKLQAFYINNGASMILKNITIQNGASDNGGVIKNHGTLILTDSTLANNIATLFGGAIINNGKLNITNSTLTNNTARDGGSIFNNKTLSITNSILNNNNADDDGGAIYNRETLTIINSTLNNNQVNTFGGAIENYGTIKITDSTLNNNDAISGGAISSINGILTITKSTLSNNTVNKDGGAIYNHGTLTITQSTLANNNATLGGAIINKIYKYFNITNTNFTNNHAKEGGAIRSPGYVNLTGNIFTNNTADNKETIDLREEWSGRFNKDVYESTDILLKNLNLSIKDNQTLFNKGEDVVLNYSIALEHPNYYDNDILERLSDITVYINGIENVTTRYENYTLSNLEPGEYSIYIKTCNQESNTVTFEVAYVNITTEVTPTHLIITAKDYKGNPVNHGTITTNLTEDNYNPDENGQVFIPLTMKGGQKLVNINYTDDRSRIKSSTNVTFHMIVPNEKINVTTWDVEIEQARGVTLSALIYEKNKTVNYGDAYFIIDDKPILTENGSVLYVPVNDSWAYLPYKMPSNMSLGNHTLSAVFIKYVTAWNKDDKTLTIIDGYVNLTTEVTPTHLIITAKDYEGKPVNHGTITTNLTEDNYCPDENGQVFIPLTMKGGEKHVNINYTDDTSDIKSSTNITFDIIVPSEKINVTTWDVEMVQGKSVTFSALVYEKNKTVNYGKVYFVIDDKPIMYENGSVIYVPVNDSWAYLPYDVPTDIELGNHTLTAVFIKYVTAWNKDDKTLSIIENIPEGAGDDEDVPSGDGKQERYRNDTTGYTMANFIKTVHSTSMIGHKVISGHSMITVDNMITLGKLNEIFGQTFINGHLLIYIDGQLVFNGTVGDDLAVVLFEIIEKFLGTHEIKVEFTDADGKTNTYTENITIT